MKNLKKAAALSLMAGGLLAAGAGVASAHGAEANGEALGSPGVVSGNVAQVPVDLDANVSGNSANVIGVGNAAFDNYAANH
ncbi:chaplin [Streptomyces sp. NPDC051940]|uniref:chaplin n=1 Tax=Streptomyces sp. NPDC051940 TaxID=3155675 RepID=UPI003447F6BC